MILSSKEIKRRIENDLVIEPFGEESLQPASYDLRAGVDVTILPKTLKLMSSLEYVELPHDVAGVLRTRSSYARKGLVLGGGFIDPGFRGNLTLCLSNMSEKEIELKKGERIVQMLLLQVKAPSEAYNGQYQDSRGAVR
ncbi:MAG: dCTP deaminase [Methanosarcinales archaeon]|nr:MAG: dCTP deaminase [Methanosarcinales archaeon]